MKNKDNVVVMSGSFNPPTKAHYLLMKTAVQATEAIKGIYVPVSQAYLERKLRQTDDARMCLSVAQHVEMLKSMCAEDERLEVSEIDVNNARSRTYDILATIQAQYPDAQICYACGEDKLGLIASWTKRGDFFDRFRIILFRRDMDKPDCLFSYGEALSNFEYAFIPITQPLGLNDVSSTRIREAFLRGQILTEDLHPEVARLLSRMSAKDFS